MTDPRPPLRAGETANTIAHIVLSRPTSFNSQKKP
jgi:hypothetical protein